MKVSLLFLVSMAATLTITIGCSPFAVKSGAGYYDAPSVEEEELPVIPDEPEEEPLYSPSKNWQGDMNLLNDSDQQLVRDDLTRLQDVACEMVKEESGYSIVDSCTLSSFIVTADTYPGAYVQLNVPLNLVTDFPARETQDYIITINGSIHKVAKKLGIRGADRSFITCIKSNYPEYYSRISNAHDLDLFPNSNFDPTVLRIFSSGDSYQDVRYKFKGVAYYNDPTFKVVNGSLSCTK